MNYLKDRDQNKRLPKSDIDLLFRSYAETFKKYTPLECNPLKMDIAKLFSEADIREIEERQIISYQYSDSTMTTDSTAPATPQSHTTPLSPLSSQAQDLSASGFQENSRDNEIFDLLRFQQTTVSTVNS